MFFQSILQSNDHKTNLGTKSELSEKYQVQFLRCFLKQFEFWDKYWCTDFPINHLLNIQHPKRS